MASRIPCKRIQKTRSYFSNWSIVYAFWLSTRNGTLLQFWVLVQAISTSKSKIKIMVRPEVSVQSNLLLFPILPTQVEVSPKLIIVTNPRRKSACSYLNNISPASSEFQGFSASIMGANTASRYEAIAMAEKDIDDWYFHNESTIFAMIALNFNMAVI